MAQRVKFPVFEVLKFTYQWTLTILRKHWIMVLAYILLPPVSVLALTFIVSYTFGRAYPKALYFAIFMCSIFWMVAFIHMALVVHAEIIRIIDSDHIEMNISTIILYFIDIVMIFFVVIIVLWSIGLCGAGIGGIIYGPLTQGKDQFGGPLLLLLMATVGLALATRLLLRLPSRVIGEPMSWGEVWRLGRGNTLRLLGGSLLIAVVFLVATAVVSAPLFLLFGEPSGAVREVVSQTHSANVGPVVVETRTTIAALSPIPSIVMWFISYAAAVTEIIAIASYFSLAYVYLCQIPEDEQEETPPASARGSGPLGTAPTCRTRRAMC
ncbi:hypothetical protein [Xanthobacter flavus]|uniref:hypothetical protein n=1 Tax=Xanthobacter flavus TaxID=281 RepID=UPI00372A8DAA